MIKSAVHNLIPSNLRDQLIIKDSIDILIDHIIENTPIAIDMFNLYNTKNSVLYEELIKIFFKNFYDVFQDNIKNQELIRKLEQKHKKALTTFDRSKIETNIVNLFNNERLQELRSFAQSKGTLKGIEYIYKLVMSMGWQQGNLSVEGEVEVTNGKNHMEYIVKGPLISELFENFIKPLSHPMGWTYIYYRMFTLSFKDYFFVEASYKIKEFYIGCDDIDSPRDDFLKNEGWLFETNSKEEILYNEDGTPRKYRAIGEPVLDVVRHGYKHSYLFDIIETKLVLDNTVTLIEKIDVNNELRINVTFASGEQLLFDQSTKQLTLYYGPKSKKFDVKKDYTTFSGHCNLHLDYEETLVSTIKEEFYTQVDTYWSNTVGFKNVVGAGNIFVGGDLSKVGDKYINRDYDMTYMNTLVDKTPLPSNYRSVDLRNKNDRYRAFERIYYENTRTYVQLNLETFDKSKYYEVILNDEVKTISPVYDNLVEFIQDTRNRKNTLIIRDTDGNIVSDIYNFKLWQLYGKEYDDPTKVTDSTEYKDMHSYKIRYFDVDSEIEIKESEATEIELQTPENTRAHTSLLSAQEEALRRANIPKGYEIGDWVSLSSVDAIPGITDTTYGVSHIEEAKDKARELLPEGVKLDDWVTLSNWDHDSGQTEVVSSTISIKDAQLKAKELVPENYEIVKWFQTKNNNTDKKYETNIVTSETSMDDVKEQAKLLLPEDYRDIHFVIKSNKKSEFRKTTEVVSEESLDKVQEELLKLLPENTLSYEFIKTSDVKLREVNTPVISTRESIEESQERARRIIPENAEILKWVTVKQKPTENKRTATSQSVLLEDDARETAINKVPDKSENVQVHVQKDTSTKVTFTSDTKFYLKDYTSKEEAQTEAIEYAKELLKKKYPTAEVQNISPKFYDAGGFSYYNVVINAVLIYYTAYCTYTTRSEFSGYYRYRVPAKYSGYCTYLTRNNFSGYYTYKLKKLFSGYFTYERQASYSGYWEYHYPADYRGYFPYLEKRVSSTDDSRFDETPIEYYEPKEYYNKFTQLEKGVDHQRRRYLVEDIWVFQNYYSGNNIAGSVVSNDYDFTSHVPTHHTGNCGIFITDDFEIKEKRKLESLFLTDNIPELNDYLVDFFNTAPYHTNWTVKSGWVDEYELTERGIIVFSDYTDIIVHVSESYFIFDDYDTEMFVYNYGDELLITNNIEYIFITSVKSGNIDGTFQGQNIGHYYPNEIEVFSNEFIVTESDNLIITKNDTLQGNVEVAENEIEVF